MERHDLLELTDEGRAYAWEHRKRSRDEDTSCWREYAGIPAIYTGRTDPADTALLEIGFSFPLRVNGVRRRIGAFVPAEAIRHIQTPWELTAAGESLPGAFGDLLRNLREAAWESEVRLGLFGATALQVVTRRPYLHESSDLDLLLEAGNVDRLEDFMRFLQEEEAKTGVRIDAELKAGQELYVKFRELFYGQKTILAKGGMTPRLLSCQSVWESIRTADSNNTNKKTRKKEES